MSRDLLPCPFCGARMVLQGDYTPDAAWNLYGHDLSHKGADTCLLSHFTIGTLADMVTPNPSQASAWNTRAKGGER